MEKSNTSLAQSYFGKKAEDQSILEMEEGVLASKEDTQAYFNKLKTYFISGKKTDESLAVDAQPVPLSWGTTEAPFQSDYPVYHDAVTNDLIPLYTTLENGVKKHFEEQSSTIISGELAPVFETALQTIQEEGKESAPLRLIEIILKKIQSLDLPQKDTQAFEEQIGNFRKELENQVNLLFGFHSKTVFQILSLQNKLRSDLKFEFLRKLKKGIRGLNELMILHSDASGLSNIQMDFAEDLIAFDKIRNIGAPKVSSQIPEARLQRLKSALQTLTDAQQYYAQSSIRIFTSEEVNRSFKLKEAFDAIQMDTSSDHVCRAANIQSQKDLNQLVQTVAALRMGQLMVGQQYNDALHDDYFDHFDLHHLTKEDLQYLPPILVIEHSRNLAFQSSDFFTALSQNSFVKVLGINLLDDLFDIKEGPSDSLELASLAIFRRNSYVFQTGMDVPSDLNEACKKGLDFPGPVFWNILIPSKGIANEYSLLKAATESRYFPSIEYRVEDNYFAGHPINLQKNPAADTSMLTFKQKIQTPKEKALLTLGLTVGEFLAMDSKLKATLEIIPTAYQSTLFIPLFEYLRQPVDSSRGAIPFIWLADDQNKLRRAAIPVYWIQKCRNRLAYWRFLQSISGIHDTHLQNTIEAVKSEWEETKNTEIEALTLALREKYEKEKTADLQKAVTNILYGLLSQGNGVESVLTAISKEDVQPDVEAHSEPEPALPANEKKEEQDQQPKATVSEEPWVESEDCTSCKDCVDALPAVFKYNEDKQAYVHNPKGGTFAEIVKAAEKCPARCIHPGTPQNKKEASLEKWIKRAEKFN